MHLKIHIPQTYSNSTCLSISIDSNFKPNVIPLDPLITPEIFAQSIVDDFKLAVHHGHTIAKAVHEQLAEHEGVEEAEKGEESPAGVINKYEEGEGGVGEGRDGGAGDDGRERGALDEEGEEWWRCWRKRIRTEDGYVKLGGEDSEREAEAEADMDIAVGDDGEADAEADDEAPKERGREKGKERRKRRKVRRKFGVMVPEVMGDVPMEVDEIVVENMQVDEEMRILIKVCVLGFGVLKI